jgi:hypothetical protein
MAAKAKKRQVTTLAPWFGSDRMTAENYADALGRCEWVGIPFAGGMSIVSRLTKARTVVCNDKHHHMINLARVVRDDRLRPRLIDDLEARLFHPLALSASQAVCRTAEEQHWSPVGDVEWAGHFFFAAWAGRNGEAGGKREFDAPLSIRWNAAGGDSVVRLRSAVAAIDEWAKVFRERNVSFVCEDAMVFLSKCHDAPGHGLYVDPPFPGPGDRYRHNCGDTEKEQRDWHEALRGWLGKFSKTLVVCRFYDHPLVRELYPEDRWDWHSFPGRAQTNDARPEVMIVNRSAV